MLPLVWPVTRSLPKTVVGYMAMASERDLRNAGGSNILRALEPVLPGRSAEMDPELLAEDRPSKFARVEAEEKEDYSDLPDLESGSDDEDRADTEDDEEGTASDPMDNFFLLATEEDYRNMTIEEFYAWADRDKQKWIGQLPAAMFHAMRDSYFKDDSPRIYSPTSHGTLEYEEDASKRTPMFVMRQGDGGVIRRQVTRREQRAIFRKNKPSDKMFHFY